MITITLARKPCAGSVANTATVHGTGGLNINATRISFASESDKWKYSTSTVPVYGSYMDGAGQDYRGKHHNPTVLNTQPHEGGRWPANVLFEHTPGCVLLGTKQVKGSSPVTGNEPSRSTSRVYGSYNQRASSSYADEDGLETMSDWRCIEGCPVADLNVKGGQSILGRAVRWMQEGADFGTRTFAGYNDSGSASRFFKTVGGKR